MLRRLTLGFGLVISAVTAFAACSSTSNSAVSIGPSFPPQSVYASNSTQNAVSIFPVGTKSGSGPAYQIGSQSFAGPQYLAFDSFSDLFVTNYNVAAGTGSIVEIKALATGNVTALNSVSVGTVRPRGIAFYMQPIAVASASPVPAFVVASVNSAAVAGFTNELVFYNTLIGAFQTIAGPNTQMNVPSGVAFDASQNLYVTNLQGSSVEVFALPTASPTPSTSPSPTPTTTPTPSPLPSGATPTPSPTPVPTPTPINIAPLRTISGAASGLGQPSGIAIDGSGNIYVSDSAAAAGVLPAGSCAKATCPAVLIFPAGANGAVAPKAIAGPLSLLNAPSDVKLDKAGNIYVADTTASGTGVVYVFAPGTSGNVAPATIYKSPGAAIGIGITP
ncbi:MAG: hypothetical protein M3N13_09035 [Candidatus Eremiobacteraeota bacterium]|nr:hypothetical protein [Candidatus Eremiobacteraeota bacterium]